MNSRFSVFIILALSLTASAQNTPTSDPQSSLSLDPGVIASGFANDGQNVSAAGQVASLTSTNNFINFCLTVPNLPITNGKQLTNGSCNPAPMGSIPSTDNMPSAKFQNPKNGDTYKANTSFTVILAIQGMATGFFVNADDNYYAAPQQLNAQGQIQGHGHAVIESLNSLSQISLTDPRNFAFFMGMNVAAQNGILTANVTDGLPSGFYRLSSILTAANHQPVLVPVARHGALDDTVYVCKLSALYQSEVTMNSYRFEQFTVTDDGTPISGSALGGSNTTSGTSGSGSAASDTSRTVACLRFLHAILFASVIPLTVLFPL